MAPTFAYTTCVILDTEGLSDAVATVVLQPLLRRVVIEWQSGHLSDHTGVRKRDMLRLLDKRQSFGKWVNTYVL